MVDYVGYGPFAHTDTKPNNFAMLGFEGYRELQKHAEIEIPVIAVGGISLQDVDRLIAADVYGIAVSAAINLAPNPAATIKEFYRKIY